MNVKYPNCLAGIWAQIDKNKSAMGRAKLQNFTSVLHSAVKVFGETTFVKDTNDLTLQK